MAAKAVKTENTEKQKNLRLEVIKTILENDSESVSSYCIIQKANKIVQYILNNELPEAPQ